MKVQELFGFVVLAMMITTSSAHIGGSQISVQDIEPQVYCGRDLARAISVLCFGLPMNDKRAMGSSVYHSMMSQYYNQDQEPQSSWPWIPHHRARTMSLPSRDKRYVVKECCEKPCSITELMSYC